MNNDQNEIFEEQPLIDANNHFGQEKKTYSLNTGLHHASGSVGQYSGDLDADRKIQAKKAMTLAARGMSLATRADIDPIALIENAKKNCNQPIKLSWENVKFTAQVATTKAEKAAGQGPTRDLEIVKTVSGFAAPGQATFIMGSSGAGKTSLLNILADRVSSATNTWLEGNITFNDEIPVNKDTFQKFAAYVMQDDVLFSTFTVEEAITFAARLKLKVDERAQDLLVDEIINDLGMNHIRRSQIGDIHRKILSGGERKRCSIGVELVSDPSVILLDEPTSGLDAFKALSICKLLHDLARKKGKTVVSTIHSPSSDAFFFFDRLILMCDGHIVYQGDAKYSPEYFRKIDRPVPKFANPADFFMKLLSINYPKMPQDEENIKYLNRYYHALIENEVRASNRMVRLPPPKMSGAEAINHKASQSVQLQQLMHRSWTLAKREPRLSRAKIIQTVVVSLLMMGAFWQVNNYADGIEEVQNMAGAIYFMTVVQMFLNFQPTVIVFQGEKPIFARERAAGMYDIWVYATTKLIAELPIMLFVPFLFLCMNYFAIGLTDSFTQFFSFYLVLFLMIQAATAMGYALSSLFNHETTAVAFAPILNMPLNLLGGYMINLKSIFQQSPQRYIAWLMYFSPVRYGFTAMMVSQFPITNQGQDVEDDTNLILEQYGFNDKSYWTCVLMLLVLFITFRLLVIFSLWCQDRKGGPSENDTRNTTIGQKNKKPALEQSRE